MVYRLLTALSIMVFSINGMNYGYMGHNGHLLDSYFSLDELEEYDSRQGARDACKEIVKMCNLDDLANYNCVYNLKYNDPRGGSYMNIFIKEKTTENLICHFEFNRITQELQRIK